MMAQEGSIDGALLSRRVTVTEVRRRRVVVGGGPVPSSVPVPCARCGTDVTAVTPEVASALLRSDPASLAALIERGVVHAVSAASGAVWICRRSLFPGGRP